jgi:predicted transcriptional regulator
MSDLISKAEIAPLLGITDRMVRNHLRKGTFKPDASGFYNRETVVEAYTKFRKDFERRKGQRDVYATNKTSAGNTGDDISEAELASRVFKTQSMLRKDQQKLAVLESEAHLTDTYREAYTRLRQDILAELSKLPVIIADALNGEKDVSTVGGIIEDQAKECLWRLKAITLPESEDEELDEEIVASQDLWGALTVAKTARNIAQGRIAELQAAMFSGEALYADHCRNVLSQRISNARSKILSLSSSLARMLRGAPREMVIAEVSSSIADATREIPEWNVSEWRTSAVTLFAKVEKRESAEEE